MNGKFVTVKERSWLKVQPETGVYWIDITRKGKGRLKKKIVDPVGVRDQVTKARALELGDKIVGQWLESTTRKERMLFSEAAEMAITVSGSKNRKSSTDVMHRFTRLHLLPSFGPMALEFIGDYEWAKHVERRRRARPNCALENDAKYLNVVMNWARKNGVAVSNFRAVAPEHVKRVQRTISRAAFNKMFQTANPEMRIILRLGWECGMRKSEILNLEWSRVDLKQGIIELYPHHAKTRMGRRFPVPQDLLSELRKMPHVGPFVFPHRHDPSRPRTTIGKSLERIKNRSGISGVTFHSTRHSFITRKLAEENQSLVLTCRYAGLSPEVATKVYLHEKVADLARLVRGSSPVKTVGVNK